MSDEADQTRRWLINASGAAILSGAIPGSSAHTSNKLESSRKPLVNEIGGRTRKKRKSQQVQRASD